jgi:hypothetical protein
LKKKSFLSFESKPLAGSRVGCGRRQAAQISVENLPRKQQPPPPRTFLHFCRFLFALLNLWKNKKCTYFHNRNVQQHTRDKRRGSSVNNNEVFLVLFFPQASGRGGGRLLRKKDSD